ncbi:ATP-binding cassette domain-containing protein [Kribbella sp.]|uniref:ABC transporter ATP-binding protein n=1 Tax=Kribbella sp. TaxID=1871183 RepID=UPI002D6250AA|nr:ATP-binding cassette domain-containing protein [Kribbella sp.]HZX06116.1 ATP-binding cassette domain-containing protein [Kribbella sp.]
MLEIEGLRKRYGGTVALDGCTFTVAPKRLVGLLGPNGAGKTTLMRCLLGLVVPDGGEVRWLGAPLDGDRGRRFGYMPEERGLYPSMRVAEQVRYFAMLSGLPSAAAAEATTGVLHRVGASDLSERRVEELSHGNQQRIQLAVALVHDPEILVLDEPFAGLDPLGVDQFGALLLDLAADGTTVLFSSHQLDLVQHLCQDIVTIDRGRVVLAGELEQLQRATAHRRVTVVFAEPSTTAWTTGLPNITVERADDRHVQLRLEADSDPDHVLRAARTAGSVLRFDYEPPSLEELFREAVGR